MQKKQPEVTISLPPPHSDIQRKIMSSFLDPNGPSEVFVSCGTKFGKACHIDTPILTTKGWRNFGDLIEGDFVFTEHGKRTEVEFVTDTMHNHKCYEVVFSDGNKIIADAEHVWVTTTHAARKNMARAKSEKDRCKSTACKPESRTTEEIAETLEVMVGGKLRANHAIPVVSGPVNLPPKNLQIAPYVLGCWLGDGSKHGGTFTNIDLPIIEEIRSAGYVVKKSKHPNSWGIHGLMPALRNLDLLLNKFIPPEYLMSWADDRLSLLAGLMDTDGTISKRGDCCFDNTNKDLADGVEALAVSLGIKCNRQERYGQLNGGVRHKKCYRVHFTTDLPVFRLPRKLERIREVSSKAKQRTIVEVNPVPSVPVRCIRVKNKTHLFLIGRGLIPTHNTLACSVALGAAMPRHPKTEWRWVAPYYSQSVIGFDNLKAILPKQYTKARKSSMQIEMPSIEALCKFVHAQNAEQLEGHQIHGYVLDEAAKVGEQVYYSARTTVTRTRSVGMGKFLVPSTPVGRNWFYRMCMEAQNEMELAKLNNRRAESIFFTAPTSANPFISKDVIADAKIRLPDRLFRQYYLAEWLDESSTFTNVIGCLFGQPFELAVGPYAVWFDKRASECSVVIGADWARGKEKSNDSTVYTAIDYEAEPAKVVGILKLKGLSYTDQIKQLLRFTQAFHDVVKVSHDKTGVGIALEDQLALTGLVYEGQHFSRQSKSELVCNLITAFEQSRLAIPNCSDLKAELESYEMDVTEQGHMSFQAAQGSHDDMVCSLMLAWKLARRYADIEVEFRSLGDLNKTPLRTFYDEMIEDDDDIYGDWIETIKTVRSGK